MVRFSSPNRPVDRRIFSGRERWRLFSLVVALGLVVMIMLELRQPETAATIDRIFAVDDDPEVGGRPAASKTSRQSSPVVSGAAKQSVDKARLVEPSSDTNGAALAKLLALAGWDAERLARFGDGDALSDPQRQELLELLRRLRSFDAAAVALWTRTDLSPAQIAASPNDHRGEMIRLTGQVRQVTRRTLPSDLAARLEMPAYIECQLALDDEAGMVTIITARVPKAWTEMDPLDEPAAAAGVFVKLLPETDGQPAALFISQEVAWHPEHPRDPYVSFGFAVLGSLGMDVGLLDEVRHRGPIAATEREAFYQMLDAAGRAGANQLIRFASRHLESVRKQWADEAARLVALARASADGQSDADRQRLRLALEVARHSAEGRYSVAPLFNDAENQVGELVVLEGVVRRAIRVDVRKLPDGLPSDATRRFGIDHYFEVDVFTDDSQDNPVVFCVRELPAGFPTGDSIREPVRAAGFFFKTWSFASRRGQAADVASAAGPTTARQLAPLLIGRGPVWIQSSEEAVRNFTGVLAGGLFVLILAGIWLAGWCYARGDRRFRERTLAPRVALPPGESLNELDLSADDAAERN